jgi:integrase
MLEEIRLFAEGKEQTTKDNYLNYGKKLEAFLEKRHLTLKTLTPIDVKAYIYEAGTNSEDQLVMNSAAIHKQFICSLLRAIDRKDTADWIRKNVREIHKEDKFKVDLTLEEILALIRVTEPLKLKLAWSLMSFDGLRAGEVLGLFYEDIDIENKVIRLLRRLNEPYYPKGMKVNDEPVIIPLNELSEELFKQLTYIRGERIFPFSYKTLRKWFNRYVAEANWTAKDYPFTLHKLRHFFGHFWRWSKGDIQVLKEVMRHSDLRYTMLYTAPSDTEIKTEFQKVMKV